MKKLLTLVLFMQVAGLLASSQPGIGNLPIDNFGNPITMDALKPRFSWQLSSEKHNITQTACEIKAMSGKTVALKSRKVAM